MRDYLRELLDPHTLVGIVCAVGLAAMSFLCATGRLS